MLSGSLVSPIRRACQADRPKSFPDTWKGSDKPNCLSTDTTMRMQDMTMKTRGNTLNIKDMTMAKPMRRIRMNRVNTKKTMGNRIVRNKTRASNMKNKEKRENKMIRRDKV